MVLEHRRKLVFVLWQQQRLDRAGRQCAKGLIGRREYGQRTIALERINESGCLRRDNQGLESAGSSGRVDDIHLLAMVAGKGRGSECKGSKCGQGDFQRFHSNAPGGLQNYIGHDPRPYLRNKLFPQEPWPKPADGNTVSRQHRLLVWLFPAVAIESREAILMFKSLYERIVSQISAEDIEADKRDAAVRLATAVLMVDVAVVDASFDETEFDRMLGLIKRQFGLGTQEAADLINAANAKADELVSVHQLTALLNDNLDQDEKSGVVRLLWSIAYSDGQLDKYENSLVLKVSELLGVSREEVKRLKHETNPVVRDA